MSKTYPEYRDSGVEWLGEVPEHWPLSKLKHASEVNPRKGSSDFEKDSDELMTFLPMENVSEDGRIDTSIQKPVSELWSGYTYFERGDAIVAKITPCFENGKAAHLSNLGSPIGFGSTEFHVLRPREGVSDGRFLYYLAFSHVFRETGEAFMTGAAGQKRIPTQFVEEFELALPPLEEQRTIAAYLDRKTAQIDTLIAKKQRLIDLLQEQRTAVINRAVTKGLDPNAPMQESGIEWLGEVPAHWDTGKLRHVAQFCGGGTPSKSNDEYWQGDIPWVSPKDMKTDWVSDTEDHVTEEAIEESSTKMVEEGAVLLVVRSGILRHSLPVAINTRPVTLNQDMKAIVPDESLMPDYLRFYIIGNESNLLQEWRKQGATVESIEQQFLAEHRMPLPPVKEQSAIVDFLNNRCQEIERTVDKERKTIELLQELRTSLISEVVTGKIDVRDEVPERAEVAA